MRFQTRKSSCGPAAVRNALEALGHVRTEEEIAQLARQTAEGTDPKGVLRALRSVAKSCDLVGPNVLNERSPQVAMLKLLEADRKSVV